MAVLSLRCGAGFSPVAVCGLLIVVVSLVLEHRLVAVVPGPGCSPASRRDLFESGVEPLSFPLAGRAFAREALQCHS